jgi:CBS-domain-containing membrane protein
MPWLLRHHQRRVVLAVFNVLMGAISLATISVVALLTHSPFVFPSLGPAAYLFFYRPGSVAASPRNALTGGAVGILAGYVALLVTGLVGAPAVELEGVTWPRVLAVALAFSLTTVALILLDVSHPPALATTLVVALGAFTQPVTLLTLYGGIVLLTAEAFLINRAAGLPYPLWRAHPQAFQRALADGLARPEYSSPKPSAPSKNPLADA